MAQAQELSNSKIGKIAAALAVVAVFTIGFFTSLMLSPYVFPKAEVSSPSDFITEDNIQVYPDRVVIELDNASLSTYASTGSMVPLFDYGANGIRVKPQSPDEISLGDIVTYEMGGMLIVHRVIEKGEDENGVYFIVKGDNNASPDGQIRFSDIRYKTVAILY